MKSSDDGRDEFSGVAWNWGGGGVAFHQPGTVNENVLESDFVPLCDDTTRRHSLADLRLNVLKRLSVSDVLLILLWKYEALAVCTSAEKYESKDCV